MKTKGFTLIELLVYISGLLVLGTVLIFMIIQFFSIYKEIIATIRSDRTGLLIVDRVTKEIRSANQINMLESQFNTVNGFLELDSVKENTKIKKRFFVENGVAKFQKDNETPLELSSKDFTVSNFNLNLVSTPVSEGIRFTIELQFTTRNATETKSYTGFAILRESYE